MLRFTVDTEQIEPPPSNAEAVKANLRGKGGFGIVYEARFRGSRVRVPCQAKECAALTAQVAVKLFIEQSLDARSLAMSRREVLVMAKLVHPRLVRLVGASLRAPHMCLVLEFVERGSLRDLLSREDAPSLLPLPRRLQIALDMVDGLLFMHERGVLHRDVKAANVLVDADFRGKVCDFGFAALKEETKTKTKVVGSITHTPPEILLDEHPHFTAASDTYSAAVTVYEILSFR